MKATDLMIGDWVSIKPLSAYIYTRRKIKIQDFYNLHKMDFVPIPLTREMLVKNGFNPETFLTALWEKEIYFKEFPGCVVEPDNSGKYIFGTTTYWKEIDSDGSPIDWGTMYDTRIHNLQYVHELQRALRLCGLNELADNFKV